MKELSKDPSLIMSPGVPQDSSLLDFSSEAPSMLRSLRREGSLLREGVDQRAVGGHLALAKRNSTPVGAGVAMGVLSGGLATGRNHSTSGPAASTGPSEHRRLDRCHSEPAKGGGNSSRYKTELCRPFEEHGFCKYGDKCQFAHGGAELRTLNRHPKYKTELCRTFHTIGFCPYGPRCHFIHNAEERRGAPPPPSPGPNPPPPISPRPHMLMGGLGSAADSPSPPSSLHGSPTTPSAFFDDTFSLFPGCGRGRGLLEGLTVGLHGLGPTGPASPSPGGSLPGLDTPPVSPVESLAGDLDSLSLSSSHSASPTPHTHALDIPRSLRLPIFEQLCEHD